jgi:hypothetical protein
MKLAHPSHPQRPAPRLMRGVQDENRSNPRLIFEPCLDSPTYIKLIKHIFPRGASSQILREAFLATMPFINFLRGFRDTFRSRVK